MGKPSVSKSCNNFQTMNVPARAKKYGRIYWVELLKAAVLYELSMYFGGSDMRLWTTLPLVS